MIVPHSTYSVEWNIFCFALPFIATLLIKCFTDARMSRHGGVNSISKLNSFTSSNESNSLNTTMMKLNTKPSMKLTTGIQAKILSLLVTNLEIEEYLKTSKYRDMKTLMLKLSKTGDDMRILAGIPIFTFADFIIDLLRCCIAVECRDKTFIKTKTDLTPPINYDAYPILDRIQSMVAERILSQFQIELPNTTAVIDSYADFIPKLPIYYKTVSHAKKKASKSSLGVVSTLNDDVIQVEHQNNIDSKKKVHVDGANDNSSSNSAYVNESSDNNLTVNNSTSVTKINGCSNCEETDTTKRCHKCKQVYYCSLKCQVSHWNEHVASGNCIASESRK